MKKACALLLVFLFFISAVCALTSADSPFLDNPASLFFYNQQRTFGTELFSGVSPKAGEPFISSPFMGIRAVFTSKYAQAGLSVSINSQNRRSQESRVYYDLYDDISFNVGAAYGYKAFGFGIRVETASKMQRLDCPVSYRNALIDFLNQAVFAQYDRVPGSESSNLAAGLGIKAGNFSFYISAPSVLSYKDNKTQFDGESIYKALGAGLYYNGERFGTRGRLKTFVFDAAAVITDIFDDDERKAELSTALTIQLSRDRNVRLALSVSGKPYRFGADLSYTAEKAVFAVEADVSAGGRSYYTFRTSLLF